MESLKNFVLVSGDFGREGGMDRANYELAQYLAKHAQVHLVAHSVAGSLLATPRVAWHKVARPLGNHTLGGVLLARRGGQIASEISAARVIVNGGNCVWPDINWVHYVHHAWSARLSHLAPHLQAKHRLMELWYRRREQIALRKARLLIANSECTKRDLIRYLKIPSNSIHVVYLGTDPGVYSPVTEDERMRARIHFGIAPDISIALFVGALGHDDRKGLASTLLAWRAVIANHPSAVLIVAGGGRIRYWERVVAELDLCENVRLIGHISNVSEILAAADVFVAPARYESYGLAVQEALCREIPAITSACSGVAERYGDDLAEWLLPDPSNAVDLAKRIESVFQNRHRAHQMVQPLGRALRSYTWEMTAARFAQVVDDN